MSRRVTDYDDIADGYDRRYEIHDYAGVRDTLRAFLGDTPLDAVLEVGCGTGHWLREAAGRGRVVAGLDPSTAMLGRARRGAPDAVIVRGRAEALPFGDGRFDRVFCINALHHFADREQFFAEAFRVLKPRGGLFSVGKDPHTDRDSWWVYDYFPETQQIDRDRFAPVRRLRGELAVAGFAWAESCEADHIERVMPADETLAAGLADRAYTSQLSVLTDDEYAAGVARVRGAGDAPLVCDFRLFAVSAWK